MAAKFNKGDKVFAKIKGYPYWSARVVNVFWTEKQQAKYDVKFFGTQETTTIKDNDACLYLEYKHIHGRLRTDNFRNSKFNKALKEAEESEAAEASDINTQNEDCNYKKSDVLSMSVKHLEESLTEVNLLENSENEEEKLTLAAKIGTALLEENDSLKRQNFELESKLTIAEEKAENLEREQEISASKIEELLCQIEELHNNSKKEKQIHSDMQRMF
ncbi:hepatoma-derived growth factor-like [Homalodisca vitripennis]|uniref:hepatoma-derived growth factor-like n=1 Tax=Homalodisca vitripennis TaxID=197043 RepID=UPI001EEAD87C|nr:hepatoma-derived growth factor-like [Homalodisca vitripennis]